MWFFCRQHALDTPRDILRSARLLLQQELYAVRPLYAQAIAQSQVRGGGDQRCGPW
jgi:hypothetical protein